MAKNALDVRGMPSDAELKRMFDAVPVLERFQVGDKVLTAGSGPIVSRARALAPRSTPEDRNKRSQRQKSAANWDMPLHKTIAKVRRKANRRGNAYVVIGPRWPEGNKAYFNTSPDGRKMWFWGRESNRVYPQIRNWIVQAFDEARQASIAKQKAKLKQLMDQIWRDR